MPLQVTKSNERNIESMCPNSLVIVFTFSFAGSRLPIVRTLLLALIPMRQIIVPVQFLQAALHGRPP